MRLGNKFALDDVRRYTTFQQMYFISLIWHTLFRNCIHRPYQSKFQINLRRTDQSRYLGCATLCATGPLRGQRPWHSLYHVSTNIWCWGNWYPELFHEKAHLKARVNDSSFGSGEHRTRANGVYKLEDEYKTRKWWISVCSRHVVWMWDLSQAKCVW